MEYVLKFPIPLYNVLFPLSRRKYRKTIFSGESFFKEKGFPAPRPKTFKQNTDAKVTRTDFVLFSAFGGRRNGKVLHSFSTGSGKTGRTHFRRFIHTERIFMRSDSERAFPALRFYNGERESFFVVSRGAENKFSTAVCGKPVFYGIRKFSGFLYFFQAIFQNILPFIIHTRRITSVENENQQKVSNSLLWKTFRRDREKRRSGTSLRGKFSQFPEIHKNSILFSKNGCSSAFPNRVIHRSMWITLARRRRLPLKIGVFVAE